MVHFRQVHEVSSHSYAYLLADTDAREAVIIDPAVGKTTLYLSLLDEIQSRLTHILLTHVHASIPEGATALRHASHARLVAGESCRIDCADLKITDGDIIVFGNELVRCRTTPGHTRGCISYLWRDRVFTGDALLICDCGSTEADGSDAGVLFDSLTRKLLPLADEILIYPAHDFAGRRVSCIGEQREANPKLKGTTRDEFIAKQIQIKRDLTA